MEMFIYLAGPIQGCTANEAVEWRKDIALRLRSHNKNIIAISPLRCEPEIKKDEKYAATYDDECFGTERAISSKNDFDVTNCHLGLFYIPKPRPYQTEAFNQFINLHFKMPFNQITPQTFSHIDLFNAFMAGFQLRGIHSLGTVGELFWANKIHKPTILVSDDEFIHNHPLIDAVCKWKFYNFDQAVRLIVGIADGYCGGKNV